MTRLKKILNKKNMTQKKLSQKADVAQYIISNLCQGKAKNFHFSTAKKICNVLNCSLDQAFGDYEFNEEEEV